MSVPNYKLQDSKYGVHINVNTLNTDLDHLHDPFLHQGHDNYDDNDDEDDEIIRVVSRRNPLGLSSAAACSYGKVIGKTFSMRTGLEDEKQSSSSEIEKVVRRAFSMRASSASVKEVYHRMDHRYDSVPVADEENATMAVQTKKEESNKKGNKILDVCRRFFGF